MKLVLGAVALGIFAIACQSQLDPSLTELEVGDCVRDPGAVSEVQELDTIDCTEPDVRRVTKTFEITGHDSFPGDFEVNSIALEGCSPAPLWLFPTEESWNEASDRLIVCFE